MSEKRKPFALDPLSVESFVRQFQNHMDREILASCGVPEYIINASHEGCRAFDELIRDVDWLERKP